MKFAMNKYEIPTSPTANEIVDLIQSLGWSETEAGKLLHASYRTFHQWVTGDRRMHPCYWDLLRLKAGRIKITDLISIEDIRSQPRGAKKKQHNGA
jgi:hypothetical protein